MRQLFGIIVLVGGLFALMPGGLVAAFALEAPSPQPEMYLIASVAAGVPVAIMGFGFWLLVGGRKSPD